MRRGRNVHMDEPFDDGKLVHIQLRDAGRHRLFERAWVCSDEQQHVPCGVHVLDKQRVCSGLDVHVELDPAEVRESVRVLCVERGVLCSKRVLVEPCDLVVPAGDSDWVRVCSAGRVHWGRVSMAAVRVQRALRYPVRRHRVMQR